jgi:hypothetical protein
MQLQHRASYCADCAHGCPPRGDPVRIPAVYVGHRSRTDAPLAAVIEAFRRIAKTAAPRFRRCWAKLRSKSSPMRAGRSCRRNCRVSVPLRSRNPGPRRRDRRCSRVRTRRSGPAKRAPFRVRTILCEARATQPLRSSIVAVLSLRERTCGSLLAKAPEFPSGAFILLPPRSFELVPPANARPAIPTESVDFRNTASREKSLRFA